MIKSLLVRNTYEEKDEETRIARVERLLNQRHGIKLDHDRIKHTVTHCMIPTNLNMIPVSMTEYEMTLGIEAEAFVVDNQEEKNLWIRIPRRSYYSYEERGTMWFMVTALCLLFLRYVFPQLFGDQSGDISFV